MTKYQYKNQSKDKIIEQLSEKICHYEDKYYEINLENIYLKKKIEDLDNQKDASGNFTNKFEYLINENKFYENLIKEKEKDYRDLADIYELEKNELTEELKVLFEENQQLKDELTCSITSNHLDKNKKYKFFKWLW